MNEIIHQSGYFLVYAFDTYKFVIKQLHGGWVCSMACND